MIKLLKALSLVLLMAINVSCDKEKGQIVAKIDNENIYQSQIDSMIYDELSQLRKEALKSYISKTLFEQEAKKRNISTTELKNLEINQKAKKVYLENIEEYSRINNIENYSSERIKNVLTNVNQRFRFEVFIDSLKTVHNVELIGNSSNSKLKDLDKIYSHKTENTTHKLKLYFIADYNCPSCLNHYERIFEICDSYKEKVQFNFVPYPGDLDNTKIFFAEALAYQNKFWELNKKLFEINQLTDSVILKIIDSHSIDYAKLMMDYKNRVNYIKKIENNRRILENLNIYSVPTIIVHDIIIPGYTSSDELVQIINYKLFNK